MARHRRRKKISLTMTKKKVGLQRKQDLMAEIRNYVDTYDRLFLFSVQNIRSSKIKEVRKKWRHSRLLLSRNRVMAVALGKTEETEYQTNLRYISQRLQGESGLLFTNRTKSETLEWFDNYVEPEFARSGNIATETVDLYAGPLPQFSHTFEVYLRRLKLPVSLVNGTVILNSDFNVCKKGAILTASKARLLKLLDRRMGHFKITIHCMWSKDGTFEDFTGPILPVTSTDKEAEDALDKEVEDGLDEEAEDGLDEEAEDALDKEAEDALDKEMDDTLNMEVEDTLDKED